MNLDMLKLANSTGATARLVIANKDDAQAEQAVARAAVAHAQQAAQQSERAATASSVKAAAQQIDSYLKSIGRNLDIHVDQDTGRTVVTVRDAATGDVIRQIPNEETLRLARSLGESAAALLDITA
jgi:flagellar protein FlaG